MRALPTETKVESGTSQSKSGTSVNLSNNGKRGTQTLGFFYEAIGEALSEIEQDFPGAKVAFLGHSIGGWVARSYIAEVTSPAYTSILGDIY